ncbi:MAG: DUF4173 domain-containing protein [Clostridia bacterium]|nr:DUF4173 domain-containing protein [Clostridia bacterium]
MEETREKTPQLPQTPEALRGWPVLLAAALLSAATFWFLRDPLTSFHAPGIGITVSHAVLTAVVLGMRRSSLRPVRGNAMGWGLLALSAALSGTYAVHANDTLRLLSLPVLILLTAQALTTLTGRRTFPPLSGEGLLEGVRRFLPGLVSQVELPFREASRRMGKARAERWLAAAAAGLIAGGLALALLSSADSVFSGLLTAGVSRFNSRSLFRLLLSAGTGLLLFSHFYTALCPARELPPLHRPAAQPAVFCAALAALALVYAAFAYVQIRYLFAGVESVRMSGGYAAYARSGFFQLTVLALLTLALILPAISLCRESRAVRFLSGLTAVLTGVIDASAFFRMRLYMQAYGLTTLRLVTVWGMAMILLALLACLARAIRPNLRICAVLALAALLTWTAGCWLPVDTIIARDHVARYNAGAGSWESLTSLEHTCCLHSVRDAFEEIRNPGNRLRALEMAEAWRARNPRMPYDWCLCERDTSP